MRNIDNFLARFKNITPPDYEVRTAVAETIKQVVGVDIDVALITVAHGAVHIKEGSVVKTEILLHTDTIMSELEKKLGNKTPKKIW